MQRRIEQANRGRQTFQLLEHAGEILALVGEQLGDAPSAAVLQIVGQDHLAHGVDAVAFEEHVLGAAKADAGRAESDGVARLLRLIRIGADFACG